MAITELDIRMTVPPQKKDLEQQAKDFEQVASVCKSVARCVGVTVWGVGYKDSWVPQTFCSSLKRFIFLAYYSLQYSDQRAETDGIRFLGFI